MAELDLDRTKVKPSAVGRLISSLKNAGMQPADMVLGHDDSDHASIHVVPAQDISQDLLDVIHELVEPHRQSERPLRASEIPADDDE